MYELQDLSRMLFQLRGGPAIGAGKQVKTAFTQVHRRLMITECTFDLQHAARSCAWGGGGAVR